MSGIFFEIPEGILKQATLIASKYSDKTIISIIEECFNYGAKSLYSDSPKPVPVERKAPDFTQKINPDVLQNISNLTESMIDLSQEEVDSSYDEDDIPESYGTPIVTSNGFFEL